MDGGEGRKREREREVFYDLLLKEDCVSNQRLDLLQLLSVSRFLCILLIHYSLLSHTDRERERERERG